MHQTFVNLITKKKKKSNYVFLKMDVLNLGGDKVIGKNKEYNQGSDNQYVSGGLYGLQKP